MSNRILTADLSIRSGVPSMAEVFLRVEHQCGEGGEVRARLMGPRCHHASTVEVAYHFRPVRAVASTYRAVIPEASPWSPAAPHLYACPVELWHAGQRLDSRLLRLGLRNIALGSRGLRYNGQLLVLRGRSIDHLDDDAASALRAGSINLLVADASRRHVWEIADRIGFAVLGKTSGEIPADLASHPSCLGWIVPDEAPLPAGAIIGTSPSHPAAPHANFLVVRPGDDVSSTDRPVLVEGDGPAPAGAPLLGNLLDS